MNWTKPPKNNEGIFYNALYPYCQSLPYFIDKRQVRQVEILERNWEIFRDEFIAYNNKGLTKNDDVRTGRGYYEPGLKTITLLTNLYRYHEKCGYFPKTMKILEAFPELSLVSINVLKSGTVVKPHYGETDATYRCHIGLIVPVGMPEVGIRVGNEERGWEEGKALVFIDGNRHKVWNHSPHDRVILMVDFIRPDVKSNKWVVCGRIWASLIMTMFIVRWDWLKKTPFFIAKLINIILGYCIISVVWMQRVFNFELPVISRKL
jgi:aspartyl/asparaginyl beta-hydroxylase (cupin superfamily)